MRRKEDSGTAPVCGIKNFFSDYFFLFGKLTFIFDKHSLSLIFPFPLVLSIG